MGVFVILVFNMMFNIRIFQPDLFRGLFSAVMRTIILL